MNVSHEPLFELDTLIRLNYSQAAASRELYVTFFPFF